MAPCFEGRFKFMSEIFPSDFNSLTLSRLIFTAGHVAQWQVIHLETCVARELKRRREAAAEEGERSGGKRGKTPSSSSARKTPRHTPGKTPGKKATGSSPSLEEEMGLIGATAEDVEGDMIKRVCEVDVGSTGLLSRFEPLIVSVVANPSQYRCPVLQTSAVLALSKYMMISHQLCEKYLQLLFTVLEKSADMAVRANTIVAAGDLAFRYPNLTEPWTPHLYARLQDPAPLVRKNTIIVLTHLILNDMIKVKGQISEMALVLEDKDESIAANARFFFSQLAKKGNDIYNVLPNIISHLSDPQRLVPREKFRNITRFLFSFVQKDKHCESLVEKICHRFRATGSEQQWRDLAHCLTQINFNDRCVRKLQDNFTCYQDKLVDRDVYTSFTSVTNKAKKFAKPETKALITELEEMMKTAQQKGLEELEAEKKARRSGRKRRMGETRLSHHLQYHYLGRKLKRLQRKHPNNSDSRLQPKEGLRK
ncbi:Condensin complex subunit 1 [Geodia barretti]|uniref:Condensin complex subunit 1 n=1 Tax=Geodia barretti TaxID=519541 RepID=A0AA35SM97_GEOBA|nr:Condensin complex subunit 1 [Geodia barretti]